MVLCSNNFSHFQVLPLTSHLCKSTSAPPRFFSMINGGETEKPNDEKVGDKQANPTCLVKNVGTFEDLGSKLEERYVIYPKSPCLG